MFDSTVVSVKELIRLDANSAILRRHEELLNSLQGILAQVKIDSSPSPSISLQGSLHDSECLQKVQVVHHSRIRDTYLSCQLLTSKRALRKDFQNLHPRVTWADQDGLTQLDDRKIAKSARDLRGPDLEHPPGPWRRSLLEFVGRSSKFVVESELAG